MTYIFISPQGQTTWNTDCADDADAHGYDLPVFLFDQEDENKKVKFMNDRKERFRSDPQIRAYPRNPRHPRSLFDLMDTTSSIQTTTRLNEVI
ncbi:MAG: hypothetical protein OIN85_09700 [Candidatus Methanoperedens sp.]|nr:hypothetical protein [Candidatus Methanoperedens sp.]